MKQGASARTLTTVEADDEDTVMIKLAIEPDPAKELEKIPKLEELELMDALSCYEFKMQAIVLMQKMVKPFTAIERNERSSMENLDDFMMDEVYQYPFDYLIEALREK